jgi:hypothetical protein
MRLDTTTGFNALSERQLDEVCASLRECVERAAGVRESAARL